jgi:uncharacterized protein
VATGVDLSHAGQPLSSIVARRMQVLEHVDHIPVQGHGRGRPGTFRAQHGGDGFAQRLSYNRAVPEQNLTALVAEACRDAPPEVVAVYAFGSLARGIGTPRSDLDVAVLLREPSARGASAVAEALLDPLERAARRTVDLVVLNGAAPDLVHRVLRDGVLLLDRDRPRRLRFEVQARNEYFDLEPIRRAYRSARAAGRRR